MGIYRRTTAVLRALLTGLCLWSSLQTVAAPLTLDIRNELGGSNGITRLAPYMAVLEDRQARLTLAEVRSDIYASRFTPGNSLVPHLHYGLSNSAFWVRIQLRNSTPAAVQRLLEISETSLSEVWFYDNPGAQDPPVSRTGLNTQFSTRAYPNRHVVFPLLLTAGDNRTVYLRIRSVNPLSLQMKLWDPVAFDMQARNDYMLQAIFTGMMLAMALYGALVWLPLRGALYLYYVAHVLLMLTSIQTISGLAGEFLPTRILAIERVHHLGFALAATSFLQFLRRMLDMGKYMPRTNRLLQVATGLCLLTPLLYLLSAPFFAPLLAGASTALMLGVLAIMLAALHKGLPSAWQVTLGYVCLLGGSQLYLLSDAHPDTWWIQNGLLLGAGLEAIVLAFALTHRFHMISLHSERMQARALENEHDLVEELRRSERTLEMKVNLRTQKLLDTQHALEAAKDRAEEATQAKSDFLATMSHEIRTPLNAIVGMSYLAMSSGLNEKARNYVEKMNAAANTLQVIISDILDFSKMEANKLDIEEIRFSLNDVMEQVSDLLLGRAIEKGLSLRMEMSPEVPTFVIGDPTRLSQILTNLVGNAIKFTRTGEVVVGALVATREARRLELRFWVRDTGIGMSEEQCGKLFQPFGQVDPSITRQFGGTGLGLAICKRLVELMDGRIWVESQAGVGSTFHFQLWLGYLAKDDAQLTQPLRLLPEPPPMKDLTVLLVEDNALNLEMALDLLNNAGMKVLTARNGREALEALARNRFDIVLMDCHMPVMDGYAATREIRKNPLWEHMPVIALTADVTNEARLRMKAAGMSDLISKPIHPQSALLTIASWAQHKSVVT
jgi:signal transduction histidine kinase/BarA-like signal transduction histidine kinase